MNALNFLFILAIETLNCTSLYHLLFAGDINCSGYTRAILTERCYETAKKKLLTPHVADNAMKRGIKRKELLYSVGITVFENAVKLNRDKREYMFIRSPTSYFFLGRGCVFGVLMHSKYAHPQNFILQRSLNALLICFVLSVVVFTRYYFLRIFSY